MFSNRDDAGVKLAEALADLDLTDPVVLALPRGGVPVAVKVAEGLRAPLDLILVRKLGSPGNPELAAGAVVDGPAHQVVFNPEVLNARGLSEADFAPAISEKLEEIAARRRMWLADRAPVPIAGRSVIVVDDGIATGATVRAALKGLAGKGAQEIILAVPVAPADVLATLSPLCTRTICLETPSPFYAVGAHYAVFDQVPDSAVAVMLEGR